MDRHQKAVTIHTTKVPLDPFEKPDKEEVFSQFTNS